LKQITSAGKLFYSGLAAIAVALFGHSLCARAVTTNVPVESFDFIPATVTIKVNDTVKWVWTGNSHSTTSNDGLWNSGVHSTGFTFTNKFSAPLKTNTASGSSVIFTDSAPVLNNNFYRVGRLPNP